MCLFKYCMWIYTNSTKSVIQKSQSSKFSFSSVCPRILPLDSKWMDDSKWQLKILHPVHRVPEFRLVALVPNDTPCGRIVTQRLDENSTHTPQNAYIQTYSSCSAENLHKTSGYQRKSVPPPCLSTGRKQGGRRNPWKSFGFWENTSKIICGANLWSVGWRRKEGRHGSPLLYTFPFFVCVGGVDIAWIPTGRWNPNLFHSSSNQSNSEIFSRIANTPPCFIPAAKQGRVFIKCSPKNPLVASSFFIRGRGNRFHCSY